MCVLDTFLIDLDYGFYFYVPLLTLVPGPDDASGPRFGVVLWSWLVRKTRESQAVSCGCLYDNLLLRVFVVCFHPCSV